MAMVFGALRRSVLRSDLWIICCFGPAQSLLGMALLGLIWVPQIHVWQLWRSKNEVLSLFRSVLRTAGIFSDYNIREYAKRRMIDGFHQNCRLLDPSSIASAFCDGKSQLEFAKKQAIVYSLYAPKSKSVMEIKSK